MSSFARIFLPVRRSVRARDCGFRHWMPCGTWVKVTRAGRARSSGRPDGCIRNRRLAMFAIVYKSDGVPVCVQVPGVSPDPVVVWNSESAARAFIASKGGGGEFQPVSVNEQAMEKMAKALGCPVEKLMLEPYPS